MQTTCHQDFKISFGGSTVENGEIDVNELAPSLLAFGDLIQNANRVINGEHSKITVKVKATAHGSFEILLSVLQDISLLEQIQNLLDFAHDNKKEIESASALIDLLFKVGAMVGGTITIGAGLLGLLKFLKGEKPERIEYKENGTIEIHKNGTIFITNHHIYNLATDPTTRETVDKALRPLKSEGIDKIAIYDNKNQEAFHIEKSEASYFTMPPQAEEEIIFQEMRKMSLSIISLTFKEDNKWRFSFGDYQFTALIEDTEFLEKIKNNDISFAKNDLLICQVEEKQISNAHKGLRVERVIKKVIEHRNAIKQLTLI